MSNFKAMRQFKLPISWLRDFTRSYDMSYRILNGALVHSDHFNKNWMKSEWNFQPGGYRTRLGMRRVLLYRAYWPMAVGFAWSKYTREIPHFYRIMSKLLCIMSSSDCWEFQPFWRPLTIALHSHLTSGTCLSPGLCMETVKSFI